MKINDKMTVNGIKVDTWMGITGICNACPYFSDDCIKKECEMIEKWIAEGKVEIG